MATFHPLMFVPTLMKTAFEATDYDYLKYVIGNAALTALPEVKEEKPLKTSARRDPKKYITVREIEKETGLNGTDVANTMRNQGYQFYDTDPFIYEERYFNREDFYKCYPDNIPRGELKRRAKAKVKRKFVVGELLSLKTKPKCGSREIIKGYKVIKYIYTMNRIETNILILKQIYGPQGHIYTLNAHDCRKLHIKYQPGLQVFPMNMNWGKFKVKLYQ